MKIWLTLVALLLALNAPFAVLAAPPNKQSTPISVGAVLPLTGELAYFGTAVQRGIELAAGEKSQAQIEVIFEDDLSNDRKATIAAVHSLVARQNIKVVILLATPSAVVVDKLVKGKNLIAFAAWDSNRRLESLSENTFGFGWSNEQTAEAMANFVSSKLGAKTAALISAQDEWSEIMGASFADSFKSLDNSIVMHERVSADETDFRSLTLQLMRAKPGVVYYPLFPASLIGITRQLRAAGFSGALSSAEGLSDSEVKQLGALAEGIYATHAHLKDSDFETRYKERFKLEELDLNLAHVALGYDLYNFISATVEEVFKQGSSVSADSLRSAITATKFSGVLGEVNFSKSRITPRRQDIMKVVEGEFRVVGE